MIEIRDATDDHLDVVCALHRDAFGPAEGDDVADLVRALVEDATARPSLSLVAVDGGTVVGHVLFTAVTVEGSRAVTGRILAPMAVAPDRQRAGIGARLIRDGLARLAEDGVDVVFVLGHPTYYPRFGFRPAGPFGLTPHHPIPPDDADAWMALEIAEGALERARGTVRCSTVLGDPRYW